MVVSVIVSVVIVIVEYRDFAGKLYLVHLADPAQCHKPLEILKSMMIMILSAI